MSSGRLSGFTGTILTTSTVCVCAVWRGTSAGGEAQGNTCGFTAVLLESPGSIPLEESRKSKLRKNPKSLPDRRRFPNRKNLRSRPGRPSRSVLSKRRSLRLRKRLPSRKARFRQRDRPTPGPRKSPGRQSFREDPPRKSFQEDPRRESLRQIRVLRRFRRNRRSWRKLKRLP